MWTSPNKSMTACQLEGEMSLAEQGEAPTPSVDELFDDSFEPLPPEAWLLDLLLLLFLVAHTNEFGVLFSLAWLNKEFEEVQRTSWLLACIGSCVVMICVFSPSVWVQCLISATRFSVLVNMTTFAIVFVEASRIEDTWSAWRLTWRRGEGRRGVSMLFTVCRVFFSVRFL